MATMARPLSSDSYRGGYNGSFPGPRYGVDEGSVGGQDLLIELDNLRSENAQLRQLCGELEQALQEATAQSPDVRAYEERMREYDGLLEEKTDTIRQLHQQLQDAQVAEGDDGEGRRQGPVPREDELLTLSEDLERERRQLQEDEQSLMEQMRQMEMTMARERAEMARQRNDLQRLYGEIRHELERLERNGALQSKMDDLKSRLQDAATRRGAAPAQGGGKPASSSALPNAQPEQQPPPPQQPAPSRGSMLGRLFGGGK
jgi:chromosome segregation ATPase